MLFFAYYYNGDLLAESKFVKTNLSIEEYEKSEYLENEIQKLKTILMKKYCIEDLDEFEQLFVYDYWIL